MIARKPVGEHSPGTVGGGGGACRHGESSEILRLAVPSIVSNVTVPLLGLVDLAISGHLGGERYIAAISVGSMIFNFMYWLMGFLRMGTSGMTSQALGAGDHCGVRLLLRRSLRVALAISAVFLVAQVPLGWALLSLINPSPQVWQLAGSYFSIVIWGCPAMLSLYSLNGWFVGMQTTRVPMLVAVFQNVVNIVASLCFVCLLGMKVEGIALGTLVAQWCGLGLAVFFMRRMLASSAGLASQATDGVGAGVDGSHGPQGNAHGVGAPSWSAFFRVNRDIFLRTLCLVSVSLAFTSAGARQGDMTLAVNTLLMTFYTIFSYVMDGFAFAGEALAGKYYGARDGVRLRGLVRALVCHWGLPIALLFTLAYALGGGVLLGLLTDDGAVVAAAGSFGAWTWLIPLAGFAAFVYDGIFIGMTMTRGMLVSAFVSAATFFSVLAVAMLSPLPEAHPVAVNHALWLAFIAYLAMRGIMQWRMLRRRLAHGCQS